MPSAAHSSFSAAYLGHTGSGWWSGLGWGAGGRRVTQIKGDVLRCLGFHVRLLQKTQIAKPVDEAELPGAKGYSVAVCQTAGHVAAIAQQVARVAAIGINVHLEVRHTERQHGGKVFVGPDGMHLVIG